MPNLISASEKLQDACCLLLSREPWYGHAATYFDWIPSKRVETMGVRLGREQLVECFYNPAFVSQLTVQELYTVIQHEIEHVVRCHCTRVGSRNPYQWNIAADMAVNGQESAPHIGYRGDNGQLTIPFRDRLVWVPQLWNPTLSAEVYYEILRQLSTELLQPFAGGLLLDDHSLWIESDVSHADARDIARFVATEATEKSQGKTPDHLNRLLEELCPSTLPWHVLLARFVHQATGGRRTTYSRRNRRQDIFGIPGVRRRSHPHVSVVVDVSGSISERELATFFGEVERICAHAQLDVLLWDDDFKGFHQKYRKGDWKKIEITGGGGTDMAAPVEWLGEHGYAGACVIIFTDGYCPWPKRQCFPIMAVISSSYHSIHPTPSWLPVVTLPTDQGSTMWG